MNKLAVVAFLTLILLGGLQWYLAGNALTPYIDNYVSALNQAHPKSKLSIGETQINHGKGIASVTFSTFELNDSKTKVNIGFEGIDFRYDPKSFKKEVVKVTQLSIERAALSLDKLTLNNNLEALLTQLEQLKSEKNTINALTNGMQGNKEPTIVIEKTVIKNLHLILSSNNTPEHEHVVRNVSLPALSDGQALSWALLDIYVNAVLAAKEKSLDISSN